MTTTNNLGLTLVEQSQAQKEVTVNDAINKIDAILNTGVIDKDLSNPPGSPAEGDVYIVGPAASNDWNGQDDNVAHYTNGVWAFIAPNEGFTIWVNDEDTLYTWDGTSWIDSDTISELDNLNHLGVNTTADATNKLAVNSGAILFNNDGTDCQIKVNKNATADTASYLFQTGFSGRAEFGLIADDDFSLKISSDGSSFNEVLKTDNTTGDIRFKKQSFFDGDAVIDVAGKGLKIKEGSNARMGTATLVAGTVTVNNTSVTANTRIFLTEEGTIAAVVRVSARVVGTSFTIMSSSGTDTSKVHWMLVEPA
jgi:hypothetical protein